MRKEMKKISMIIALILAFLLIVSSTILFIIEINGGNKSLSTDKKLKADSSSVLDDENNQGNSQNNNENNSNNNDNNDSDNQNDDTINNSNTDSKDDTQNSQGNDNSNNSSNTNDTSNQGVQFLFSTTSSWEESGVACTQVDVIVKNNSKNAVSNWSAEVILPNGAEVKQIWNAKSEKSGDKFIFTSNTSQTLNPSQEYSFGMILKGVKSLDDVKTVSTNAQKTDTQTNNSNTQNNNQQTQTQPTTTQQNNNNEVIVAQNALEVPKPTTDDWLSVKGNKIVDANGKEVWLTGVNWFGYNTGTNTFDGLWSADLNSSLQGIADKGFNLLRIPISAELILQWKNGNAPQANFNQATNSYLVNMNSLQIFDYVVGQCRANGLKIMLDIHSAETDAQGHMKPVWYSDSISEQDYLNALSWVAKRYAKDDTIIAYDLKNEPHGKPNETPRAIWNDSTDANNWKYIAEKASMAVLNNNPNALVMVEGIEIYPTDIKSNGDFSSTNSADYYFNWWGGNLRGVKDYPLELGKYQNKLVYSPHDYGPTVFEQPWFEGGYTFESLYKDCWSDNWMFIYTDKIAPLLIGEWGGYMREPNIKWMTYLRQLIKENKLHHTFWCFNANSGDTGGLVLDDFKTWDMEKYNFVKEVLWQEDGKFVGLDHEIPLGKNGKTL